MKKKLLALAVCICMIVSLMPTSVFAATSTYLRVRTASSDPSLYPNYQFDNTAEGLPTNSEWTKRRTSLWNYYYVGGSYDIATYCIQMGISEITTEEFYQHNPDPISELTGEQHKYLSVALKMGHTGGNNNSAFQAATQIVVWMITTGAYTNDNYVNAILDGYIKDSSVRSYAKQIWNDCLTYFTIPSFMAEESAEEYPEYQMKWNEEEGCYYLRLTDTNGVIEHFDFSDNDNRITTEVDGNDLIITSDEQIDDLELSCRATTAKFAYRAEVMYMYRRGYQEMAYNSEPLADPVYGYLNLAEPQSTLVINKTSTDGVVEGLKFRITSQTDAEAEPIILTTDKDGNTEEVAIPPGTYLVEEIETPARYIAPEPQTITIENDGEQHALFFYNKCRALQLTKSSEDGIVEGLEFRISSEELEYEKTVKTNAEGKWSITGLEPGIYTVEEINVPDRYIPIEPITVEITYDKEFFTVTAENKLKTGNVEVNKTDSMFGKELGNVRFGIYTEDDVFVQEVTTNEKGIAVSDVLTYGNYYLKELETAPGYHPNETEYEFSIDTDGKYEIIAVENDPRIGTVEIRYRDDGNVKTGSPRGAVLPLGLAAMFLSAVIMAAAEKKKRIRAEH